jgi:hypothetical protein
LPFNGHMAVLRESAKPQINRDNLNGIIAADCQQVDETMLPKRTWWNLTKSVLAFHFLRHFPALVGWLPAHTPRLTQVDPPRTTDNGNAGSGRN